MRGHRGVFVCVCVRERECVYELTHRGMSGTHSKTHTPSDGKPQQQLDVHRIINDWLLALVRGILAQSVREHLSGL